MPAQAAPTVHTQPPCAALRPWVKRLLVIEFSSACRDTHLPEAGLLAAFPYRGICQLEDGRPVARAALTGLCHRLRHHAHSADNAVVVAAFTPLGAAAFVRHPLDELADTTIDLADLIARPATVEKLTEQLSHALSPPRRIQLVERFLLARLHSATPDPLVAAAVDWLETAPPGARIADLVRHIGLSQSALERRFRRIVGASPRRFASLLRLQQVRRLRATGATFTDIAHAAGYFDQAHFIHDFRRVTGLAPKAYFTRAPGG